MAVKVRLRRTGSRNEPHYRIVATDSRSPRDGRFLEVLGWYDPNRDGTNYELKLDRLNHWVSNGATVSETVRSIEKRARKAAV